MQISFGAKIPVNKCSIYDKQKRKFVEATLYELDCTDKSDIRYINKAKGNWIYKNQIRQDAKDKYERLTKDKWFNFWRKKSIYDYLLIRDNQFFSIETKDKDIVCLCETELYDNDIDVFLIESPKNNRYKFTAQTMLASIAANLLNTNKNLTVKIPSNEVRKFYSDTCGFRQPKYSNGFELSNEDMIKFINGVEERKKKFSQTI